MKNNQSCIFMVLILATLLSASVSRGLTLTPVTQYEVDLGPGLNGRGTNVGLGGTSPDLQTENFSEFDIRGLDQIDSAIVNFWFVDVATRIKIVHIIFNFPIRYRPKLHII